MASATPEIDEIVRRVLARLVDLGVPSGSIRPADVAAKIASQAANSSSSAKEAVGTRIEEKVVSVDLVAKLLKPHGTLSVRRSAVITPAASDWLRQNKITVRRESVTASNASSSASSVAPMFVLGRTAWLDSLAKQFCPKQVSVRRVEMDDTALLNQALQALRSGQLRGIVAAEFAYAMNWQAARHDSVRSAVVSTWSEVPQVLSEVPANLLIVHASRWNAASMANVIRAWQRNLTKTSDRKG